MTRRVMSHRINPVKKCVDAKRASARTFTSAHHFHNENQMIKTEFTRRAVITVYYFFAGHSDVVMPSRGFWVFLLGIIWIPKPRWWDEMVPSVRSTERVSEARWFLLGVSRLKHHFYYEKEWLVNREIGKATLESGRTAHTFSLDIWLMKG